MFKSTVRTVVPALTLTFALGSASACKSEIDDKPKAKVEEAEKPADKTEDKKGKEEGGEASTAKTFALDQANSTIGFIGAKVTGDHKGSFGEFDGRATVDGGKLSGMEITVQVATLKTDDEQLDGHLKSPDFFEVETHPTATFTALSISEKSAEGATHEVAGNLEIKGTTKKVTFPATIEVEEGGVHGKADFSIKRKEWGIDYPGKPDDLIKDEVALELDLNFRPAS